MRPNKYNPNVDMVVRLSVTYDDLSKRKGSKVKYDHINILYDAWYATPLSVKRKFKELTNKYMRRWKKGIYAFGKLKKCY